MGITGLQRERNIDHKNSVKDLLSHHKKVPLKKAIYTYEYRDSFERFSETKLPTKEAFYSGMNGKIIT